MIAERRVARQNRDSFHIRKRRGGGSQHLAELRLSLRDLAQWLGHAAQSVCERVAVEDVERAPVQPGKLARRQ